MHADASRLDQGLAHPVGLVFVVGLLVNWAWPDDAVPQVAESSSVSTTDADADVEDDTPQDIDTPPAVVATMNPTAVTAPTVTDVGIRPTALSPPRHLRKPLPVLTRPHRTRLAQSSLPSPARGGTSTSTANHAVERVKLAR